VQAARLLGGRSVVAGAPHITGVRTADGEELRADVVIDAMGRMSRSPEWLTALGARRPYEEQADCGFSYYTRYFTGSSLPQRFGPIFSVLDTIAVLTLPGDNGTWSITIMTSTGDTPLKSLRHSEKWTNTLRACPLQAHWLDGEPITDVLPMAACRSLPALRRRRFAGSDGIFRRRRRLGMYQSVSRARPHHRHDARRAVARRAARDAGRSDRAGAGV
jgi:hypothetical protein